MPRPLAIGNGEMLLAFDNGYNIRDFYYPYVGLFNHLSGAKIRMGVWVEGQFAWLEDSSWRRQMSYQEKTLAASVICENAELGVRLHMQDVVYHRGNLYLKQITVHNLMNRPREARIFFSHDFRIMESDIGDTAFYYPYCGAVVHYKLNHYFLISGIDGGGGISQYTTGIKGFGHYEGTWRDAEDGLLAGNPIQQGSVDSTIGFHVDMEANGSHEVWYWIACGRTLQRAERLHRLVARRHPEDLMHDTKNYWSAWVHKSTSYFEALPDDIAQFCQRSLLIMRTQIDDRGAILAANDSDIMQTVKAHYSYMWPRDGAFIANVFDQMRYAIISRRFYEFCAQVLPTERATLMHKYSADGSMGASWHPWYIEGSAEIPFQEDGSALVLWALWKHYELMEDIDFVEPLYESFIIPMAEFMVHYRDPASLLPMPSWDLWEERRGVHAFTAACVWAGLKAGAQFARLMGDKREEVFETAAEQIRQNFKPYFYDSKRGYFLRTLYRSREGRYQPDFTPDSSVMIVPLIGMFSPEDSAVKSTVEVLQQRLWVPGEVGGMARYEGDYYFRQTEQAPGNPWFICTLWLADYQIMVARTLSDLERPRQLLEWCMKWSMPTGVMPEQMHPFTGEPLSVAPLTWSHATFVDTALRYADKLKKLG
ncbi:MAG: glycoside hydrolase family 15 protein [Fimbriimonadia bacterium]|nr:glycoside hydrolase family 15 protein [Fimbriimonadia bacterium]